MEYVVIGAGLAGLQAGYFLQRAIIHVAGPRAINFAWRTYFVGHLRAVNNNFIVGIRRREDDYIVTCSYAERRDGEVVATPRLPEDIGNGRTDEGLFRERLRRFLKEFL